MLRFNITRILKARNIEKASGFFMKMGFSSSTATRLKKGEITNLNLHHVEKLCELLKCTPNDLLEWIPKDGEDVANHPLAPLCHRDKATQVMQLINDLTFDKLQKIEEMIKNMN